MQQHKNKRFNTTLSILKKKICKNLLETSNSDVNKINYYLTAIWFLFIFFMKRANPNNDSDEEPDRKRQRLIILHSGG